MAFSTLVFPFVFLPVSLILYFVLPKQLKNAALVVCSLVFFAWGTPEYLVLMVLDIAFHYFAGRELALQKARGRSGRFVLVSSVLVNLLLLGFFKYYGFLVDNLNALLGTALRARELPMPIGVSFFTFSLLSYLFDVYRDRAPAARNVLDFSLYVTFFPKLVSGPIVQYAEMEPQLRDHPVTREGFGSGARLFLIGLAKKVLLANTLGTTFYALSALPMTQLSTLSAWLGAVCYALMLYFDFSGYSDMAIGLASMFGFRFGKNFDYPYVSQSITEFWRRWHISLGAWFRDYVYIPCGGSRAGTVRTIANLLLVWLLTGIWHGANWTFLLWGVYYGILLLLEKFVLRRVLEHLPGLLRHVLTLLLVLIGWVFFFSSSPAAAFGWIGRMFGSGNAARRRHGEVLSGGLLAPAARGRDRLVPRRLACGHQSAAPQQGLAGLLRGAVPGAAAVVHRPDDERHLFHLPVFPVLIGGDGFGRTQKSAPLPAACLPARPAAAGPSYERHPARDHSLPDARQPAHAGPHLFRQREPQAGPVPEAELVRREGRQLVFRSGVLHGRSVRRPRFLDRAAAPLPEAHGAKGIQRRLPLQRRLSYGSRPPPPPLAAMNGIWKPSMPLPRATRTCG